MEIGTPEHGKAMNQKQLGSGELARIKGMGEQRRNINKVGMAEAIRRKYA